MDHSRPLSALATRSKSSRVGSYEQLAHLYQNQSPNSRPTSAARQAAMKYSHGSRQQQQRKQQNIGDDDDDGEDVHNDETLASLTLLSAVQQLDIYLCGTDTAAASSTALSRARKPSPSSASRPLSAAATNATRPPTAGSRRSPSRVEQLPTQQGKTHPSTTLKPNGPSSSSPPSAVQQQQQRMIFEDTRDDDDDSAGEAEDFDSTTPRGHHHHPQPYHQVPNRVFNSRKNAAESIFVKRLTQLQESTERHQRAQLVRDTLRFRSKECKESLLWTRNILLVRSGKLFVNAVRRARAQRVINTLFVAEVIHYVKRKKLLAFRRAWEVEALQRVPLEPPRALVLKAFPPLQNATPDQVDAFIKLLKPKCFRMHEYLSFSTLQADVLSKSYGITVPTGGGPSRAAHPMTAPNLCTPFSRAGGGSQQQQQHSQQPESSSSGLGFRPAPDPANGGGKSVRWEASPNQNSSGGIKPSASLTQPTAPPQHSGGKHQLQQQKGHANNANASATATTLQRRVAPTDPQRAFLHLIHKGHVTVHYRALPKQPELLQKLEEVGEGELAGLEQVLGTDGRHHVTVCDSDVYCWAISVADMQSWLTRCRELFRNQQQQQQGQQQQQTQSHQDLGTVRRAMTPPPDVHAHLVENRRRYVMRVQPLTEAYLRSTSPFLKDFSSRGLQTIIKCLRPLAFHKGDIVPLMEEHDKDGVFPWTTARQREIYNSTSNSNNNDNNSSSEKKNNTPVIFFVVHGSIHIAKRVIGMTFGGDDPASTTNLRSGVAPLSAAALSSLQSGGAFPLPAAAAVPTDATSSIGTGASASFFPPGYMPAGETVRPGAAYGVAHAILEKRVGAVPTATTTAGSISSSFASPSVGAPSPATRHTTPNNKEGSGKPPLLGQQQRTRVQLSGISGPQCDVWVLRKKDLLEAQAHESVVTLLPAFTLIQGGAATNNNISSSAAHHHSNQTTAPQQHQQQQQGGGFPATGSFRPKYKDGRR